MGPRRIFAERFALLYAEAGDPPLKRVTESVTRARKLDERGRPLRVPSQRVSDWRRGRNVPARFSGLSAVLEVLIGEARKLRAAPVSDGLYDLDLWRLLWEEALASPVTDTGEQEAAEPEETGVCPYRGLAVFRQEDSGWFFGRERSTAALVARVNSTARDGGIVMLVGASGAGKSSLLRAGLVPALAGRPVVLMTPTVDPLKELAHHVPELTDVLNTVVDEDVDDHFADRVRQALAERPGLVLIVDQFEETFTLSHDEVRRRVFVEALHAMSTPTQVVLGVRADFYGSCLDYPVLAESLQDRQMVLGAMTAAELREAVARPAKAVGLQLETGLVELMLRDLGFTGGQARTKTGQGAYDAGALPLLSHALLATWQRRQAGKLTISGYRAAGGIQGAVAATAERAWADLDADGQSAARPVLLRLVHVGQDSQDTRRRSTRQEVVEQAVNSAAAEEALEVLARARLVTLDADSVEITHEALLQAWPRLRGWIDRDRAGNLLRQRIEEDAESWDDENRDPSLLYRGGRLETAHQWATLAGPAALTGVATAFLTDSVRHRKRSAWVRRAAVSLLVVFALFAATMATVSIRQRDDAQFAQIVAEADTLAATDPSLSAQLTLAAHRLRPEDQDVNAKLLSTQFTPLGMPLAGHTGAVYLTTFSPDGKVLATASLDKTVRLWDVSDRANPKPLGRPLTGAKSWVSSAVFSPDGHTLASAGDDHMIRLWDVGDPANPKPIGQPIGGQDGTIYLVAFSPDGRTLATADEHGYARLWDIHDPAHTVPLGQPLGARSGPVRSVGFSPDGRLLAAGGDDMTVQLWNVTDPANPVQVSAPLTGYRETVHSVAFSPDSRVLSTGGQDGSLQFWDVSDPAKPGRLGQAASGQRTGGIWSVAYTAGGQVLGAASEDGAVRLWNVADPASPVQIGQPLTGGSNLFALGFSPDGTTMATGGTDGVVRMWSLPPMAPLGASGGNAMMYRQDGRVLAIGGQKGVVRLWDTSSPATPRPLGQPFTTPTSGNVTPQFSADGHLMAVMSANGIWLWNVTDPANPVQIGPPLPLANRYSSSLAMSADGHLLVADHDDYSAGLWDISDPARPGSLGPPVIKHDGHYVYSSLFTPDSKTLITAGADNDIRLWNVTDPANPVQIGPPLTGHTSSILSMAMTRDGHVLASSGEDKTVRLWDISTPAAPKPLGQPLAGYDKGVSSLSFSSDGRYLATSSGDQSIRLWSVTDPANPVSLGQSITANPGTGYSVAFSPAGDFLATTGVDKILRVWHLDPEWAARRICAVTSGVLTEQVWQVNLPQVPYQPACG